MTTFPKPCCQGVGAVFQAPPGTVEMREALLLQARCALMVLSWGGRVGAPPEPHPQPELGLWEHIVGQQHRPCPHLPSPGDSEQPLASPEEPPADVHTAFQGPAPSGQAGDGRVPGRGPAWSRVPAGSPVYPLPHQRAQILPQGGRMSDPPGTCLGQDSRPPSTCRPWGSCSGPLDRKAQYWRWCRVFRTRMESLCRVGVQEGRPPPARCALPLILAEKPCQSSGPRPSVSDHDCEKQPCLLVSSGLLQASLYPHQLQSSHINPMAAPGLPARPSPSPQTP